MLNLLGEGARAVQCTLMGGVSLYMGAREHNSKRGKLSIDVCAMFVAAKAILATLPSRTLGLKQ